MKKTTALLIGLCLIFGMAGTFCACSSRAPSVEQIYDRVVELVEASYELNTVIYGKGLPVYAEDSLYAEFSHLYYDFSYAGEYEMIKEYSKFMTVNEIKEAAEQVYSTALLESAVYPMCFDGYVTDDGIGGSIFLYSRYLENGNWLYQSIDSQDYYRHVRVYDYATMRIIAPSTAKACFVEMRSWYEDSPDEVSTDTIRLVKQDDGKWYLDSFTV